MRTTCDYDTWLRFVREKEARRLKPAAEQPWPEPSRRANGRSGRYCRVWTFDAETGERKILVNGPTRTGGEVIEDALRSPHARRDLRRVFTFIVGLNPTDERIAALWHIVTRSNTWLQFERDDRLGRYLHRAVRDEARAIKRRREMDGILTSRQRQLERRAERESRRERARVPRPDIELARKQADAARRSRLAKLLLRARPSERQRALVDLMLREGYQPAEALRQLGYPMSVWQNLVRKLRRVA